MWKNRPDKHCSDDRLLAHADGELRGFARLRTAAHLQRCWECRARRSELEGQAESLARLMKSQFAGQADRTTRARTQFLDWKEKYERSLQPVRRSRGQTLRCLFAAASACLLIGLFFLPRSQKQEPKAPTAAEVLRGVRGFDSSLRAKPGTLHQVLNVEVIQIRPIKRRSTGQVEIWSDRSGNRYASRWVDERQSLKYALWRRPGKAPFVYAVGNTRVANSLFEPSAEVLTVEGLERAFFEWIRSRDWQAAPAFSEALGQDGVGLRVERLAAGGFRLHASRSGRAIHAEFTVEVEAGSYRPRLQVIRLETAESALELRVVADRLEVVPMREVRAAVFEPRVPRVPAAPPLPPLVREMPPAPVVAPPVPPAEDPTTDILFALHRAHACVGDSVQIWTGTDGNIEVRAIVPNERRRAELAEILQQTGGTLVRPEIQVRGYVSTGPERSNPLLPSDSLKVIDGMYLEALALVRLAERYGPGDATNLTPRQRKLVDIMVRDHLAALRSGSRVARTQVEPTLVAVAGAPAEPVADVFEPADWAKVAMEIFRVLDQADNLIDVPPDVGRKQAAAHLLSALAVLEQRVKQVDGFLSAAKR